MPSSSEFQPMCGVNCVLPKWYPPKPESGVTHDVGLKVMNSLTRNKDPFVTMDGSRNVRWYMCGPTVYAPSHMGHARTYLGFDIIRRILTSYFGYDVTLVMNITDLDDKIIERANEQNISNLELSQRFEAEFHEDMAMLGVHPPDVLTRVTEYMPDIVAYIETIVRKGLAYESNGSVYFAVDAFNDLDGMRYCKLVPEQVNNTALLAEGEGKLTQTFTGDKRSPRDFALWKRSKENEPFWESPWGRGRPGWHIECSVMASDVFAKMGNPTKHPTDATRMDIHSGGVDLKFPHHDNEMAQAEAHSGCRQWVNYFVHSGHLHIDGFKMSKSLKNFITIRQALELHTARQIRLCFLLHKYNAPMDYGDNTMAHAVEREKLFGNFFDNVKVALRSHAPVSHHAQAWDPRAANLEQELLRAKRAVDEALRDDFDTPAALSALADLVKAVNLYLAVDSHQDQDPPLRVVSLLVRSAGVFVTRMFRVFGLIPESSTGDVGWPVMAHGTTAAAGYDPEEALAPILDALLQFRAGVRDRARTQDVQGVLRECDAFRDDVLPLLGVKLEDKNTESVWKLVDPRELAQEKEQKELERRRKEEEKAAARAEQEKKDALHRLPPAEFMKQLTIAVTTTTENGDHDSGGGGGGSSKKEVLKYSKFDDATGLPTHFHDGEPLNKNQAKKAQKEFQGQKKKYEKAMQKG